MKSDHPDISELLLRYINQTSKSLFLTGKAGTGKTTFLKNLVNKSYKNIIVAAPTGVAAINAGGVTLHSLFHLPFGCFLPSQDFGVDITLQEKISTPKSLIAKLQMNSNKRKLLKELQLLVIDEVSMLRSDLLDAIDIILKHVRKKPNLPFGGVQILFIGDLLQLPPVVKSDEWAILQKYYKSPFFFEAQVLRQEPPIYIEFEKVYRQTDQNFIDILNRFRTNEVLEDDLELINENYREDYSELLKENYIFLTTHNRKAEKLNLSKLQEIDSEEFEYYAKVSGTFNDNAYPNDFTIQLKVGAQVMFIKNDTSDHRRYFNGKIGIVTFLDHDTIEVSFENEEDPVIVNKYEWENKKYSFNKKTNEIEEKLLGTYEQYPLKLAWAITIHKSQGLTFEKAILDLTDSFASGQVYVALSRLTSLSGLVLSSRIPARQFRKDQMLDEFSETRKSDNEIQRMLKDDRREYLKKCGQEVFMFNRLVDEINNQLSGRSSKKPINPDFRKWCRKQLDYLYELQDIGKKFSRQIETLVWEEKYLSLLLKRIEQANDYFFPKLDSLNKEAYKQKIFLKDSFHENKHGREIRDIQNAIKIQKSESEKLLWLIRSISESNFEEINNKWIGDEDTRIEPVKELKKEKTPTRDITLELYRKHNDPVKVAEERKLAISTIYGHLSFWVEQGEIKANDLMDLKKVSNILTIADSLDEIKLGSIKEKLGDEYTYEDIKIALAYQKFKENTLKEVN